MTHSILNIVNSLTSGNPSWGQTSTAGDSMYINLGSYDFFPSVIEQQFGDAFNKLWKGIDKPILLDGAKLPKMNVFDGEKGLVMEAVIPFVKKEDINVTLDPLTNGIKIEVKTHQEKNEREYHLNEISRTSFKRTFAIDKRYMVKKASAEFKDAILTIQIPFADDAEQVTLEL